MDTTNAITHPIIYTAARLEAIADRYIFGPMGTTASSMKILRLLHNHGPLTSQRIGELGGGTKSNVSQRLDYLESKGYVARDPENFPADKRKVLVKITKEGGQQIAEIQKRMKKAQICLSRHFSEKEIAGHAKFFEKINLIIDKEQKNLDKIFKANNDSKS